MLFATDREWLPVYKMDWTTHRRLHFHLDKHYPAGASHHQKIVVIDDRVAFVGGLDFALGRWDTSGHLADDPRRLGELRGEWIAPLIVMLVYIALTLFSDRVVAAITSPETFRFASLLILALIIGAGTWWLSRWLLRRQRRGSGHKP